MTGIYLALVPDGALDGLPVDVLIGVLWCPSDAIAPDVLAACVADVVGGYARDRALALTDLPPATARAL